MGCKCSSEEHSSEVLSLHDKMVNTMPAEQSPEKANKFSRKLFEENAFTTPIKAHSVLNNEDTASTAKSQTDLDKRILCEAIFKEINTIRSNPKEYIKKVKQYKTRVYTVKDQTYFKISESSSIKLRSGTKAFDSCISFLRKQEPLEPLQFSDYVKLDDFSYFANSTLSNSDNLMTECTSLNFLSGAIEKKIEECKTTFEIKNFHYDRTTFSPDLSMLSQVVDDTSSNYQRSKNIFDSSVDTIGINAIKINCKPNLYCIYLVFAKKFNC